VFFFEEVNQFFLLFFAARAGLHSSFFLFFLPVGQNMFCCCLGRNRNTVLSEIEALDLEVVLEDSEAVVVVAEVGAVTAAIIIKCLVLIVFINSPRCLHKQHSLGTIFILFALGKCFKCRYTW
jgi:hypothetical protein